MKPVKIAALLLLIAAAAFPQVKSYKEIKTPPLRNFTPQMPTRVDLANGMVILLQEDHELPLIRGSALIKGGSRNVTADKAGLVGILAGSWRTGGTESRTGDQLDDVLESRAARVETFGSEDATRVTFDVLKNDFDFVFPIFVDVLQKPAFRQDKIDLAKTQARTAISRRNDEPQGILSREAQKLGYGADSPYARTTEYATLNNITRDDLLAFHQRMVHPNNIIFGIVGDFDTATMEQKLRAAFESWPRGEAAPGAPAVNAQARPAVYFIHKDDVTQANIAALHPDTLLRRDPDFYAVTVMNEILSGGFSGRLMNDIRSKAGLAYGVGGGLGAGWDRPTLFNAFMATKSQSAEQSIDLLKQEIADLQTKPFTAEELNHAKDSILNAFVFSMDSPAKILNQQQLLAFYGYPSDWFQKYQKGIEAVTAADVERVAKKYVHPEQLAILVVGNEKDFEKPLNVAYGKVTPIDITIPEANAAPASTTAPATSPAGSSPEAKALINKVRDFVGGAAAINKVQSVREVGTMSVQTAQGPMDIDMETITQYPDSHRQVMKTPMGEMAIVSTPSATFMNGPMGVRDVPDSQKQSLRNQTKQDLLSVLKNADNPAYTFNIAGSERGAQIVQVNADGAMFKWYVDPATGRVIKKVAQGPMGEQTLEFADWKAFNGINLPTSLTITGGQSPGTGKMTTIEINPTLDAKLFEKPASQ
ncbi:MAG TPA: pitrilysin family protein [Thermoanaerobaculia bacterium]|nr:pitrilysin family protein [Thermoanaerobaculia bacterium]